MRMTVQIAWITCIAAAFGDLLATRADLSKAGKVHLRNLIGALSAIAYVTVTAHPAAAAEDPGAATSQALCIVSAHEVLDPPITLAPEPVHLTGNGTITCTGRLGEKTLDGRPGTAAWEVDTGLGIFGIHNISDCIADTGVGQMMLRLTASDGTPIELSGAFNYGGSTFGWMSGSVGDFELTSLTASGLEPDHLEENCVTVPMRHYSTTAAMLLRG